MSAAITALEPCVFRAPVDNDGFKLMPDLRRRSGDGGMALERWQDAGVDRRPADECITHHQRTEQLDDGSVIHHHEIVVADDHPDLARVGVRFEVARAYELLRWFGRGPLENYPDRHRGALIGVWERAVDEPPYLVPQEFGLRTDCRWFEFIDPTAGRVLRLDVVDPDVVHVSATRHRDADLYAAPHQTDLRRANRLVVHVDVAHRGLGTASCGPDVLDRYRITPGTHRFSYRLSMR